MRRRRTADGLAAEGLVAAALLAAVTLASPAALDAQAPPPPPDALTYEVRVLDRGWFAPPVTPDELPGLEIADAAALRVIHGPRLTWLVDAHRTPSLATARLFLDGHSAVTPGPGSLLLRGWETTADSAGLRDLELVRGARDRTIAGRTADHYTVLATIERHDPLFGERRRFRITAHLWTLPRLPFSWAPFGADRRPLPHLFPELREPLRRQLEPLGLVARAVIEVEEDRVEDGRAGAASQRISGFEIDEIGRTDAPETPGVVVDRDVTEALRRLVERRPRRVCADARAGDLPGVIEARVDLDTRSSLLGYLDGYCDAR